MFWKASLNTLTMVGKTIMANVIPPLSMVKPLLRWNTLAISGAIAVSARNPMITDGIPANRLKKTSVAERSAFDMNWLEKTAAKNESGTDITKAITVVQRDPAMKGRMPQLLPE